MSRFDITAVITAHDEGLIARASLLSMAASAQLARANGVSVEIIAILDRVNSVTQEIFEEFAPSQDQFRIVYVDYGDAGLARNRAIAEARGKWVALLDADDIWCKDWLFSAHEAASRDARAIVWHPEVNLYFDGTSHLFIHVDMEDDGFHMADLAYTNAWTSLSFTSVELFRGIPYPASDLSKHIGYEDWFWNIEVIGRGAIHKVVPDTSHAVRRRSSSLLTQTNAFGCLPPATDVFRQMIARKIASVSPGAAFS
jgi:glycosyltransferase involved in cell wall biosynthesis